MSSRCFVTWGFVSIILAVGYPPGASGQPLDPASPSQKREKEVTSGYTVKVPVNVVVVHATVTDKRGRPIKDLTADDFTVYEDGKIQPIQSFSVESHQTPQLGRRTTRQLALESTSFAEPPPLQPRRLFSLFIDDLTSPSFENIYRTIEAVRSFVTETLGEGDQVSILTASGRFQTPFTRDRRLLSQQLSQLHEKVNRHGAPQSDCPRLTDLQADKIRFGPRRLPDFNVALQEVIGCASLQAQDVGTTPTTAAEGGVGEDITIGGIQTNTGGFRSATSPETQLMAEGLVYAAALRQHEATQQRNRSLLKALSRHVQFLSHFEAKKSLVLFSDGFLSQRVRLELNNLLGLSLRAGVVVSTIDIRGLYTTILSASDRGVAGVTDSYLLEERRRMREEDAIQQEEPLAELARATGGTFVHNNNDIAAGLRSIARSQSFYYVLTYGLTEPKLDGRYHKIKVKVSRPGVEIRHRKGYFAPKERLSLEAIKRRDLENDIEAVLYGPGNLRGVPVGLSYSYFRLDEATYELSLLANIDIGGLSFLRENGHRENLIHLVIAVLDDDGQYVKGSRKKVNLKLTESSYAALLNYGLRTQVNLQLPRGRYRIKAVARDSVETRLGSSETTVEVPPEGYLSDLQRGGLWTGGAVEDAFVPQASLDFGLSYFFDAPDLARVPVSAKLEGSAVQPQISQEPRRLHFVGAAYAEDDSVAAMFSETLNLASDTRVVDYGNILKLRPGSYRFELVVSNERGTLGVAERDLEVPALDSKRLASSSLVVSQQFVPLPEQVQKMQRTLISETDPLVYKEFRVIAPVEPQIRMDRPLAVFYKLYNLAETTNTGKLQARIQLINERGGANRFPWVNLDGSLDWTDSGEATVFLGFRLPSGQLAPGSYRFVVETTESSTGRTVTGETGVLLR